MRLEIGFVVFCFLFVCTCAATTSKATSERTPKPTNLKDECAKLVKDNRSKDDNCDACVKNGKCFFCLTDGLCKPYPVSHIFPSPADCKPDMGSARWGTCSVNFKAVIITMGVLAGIILIVIPCCIYCICCQERRMSLRTRRKLQQEERKWQQEEDARKAKHAEKDKAKTVMQNVKSLWDRRGKSSEGSSVSEAFRSFREKSSKPKSVVQLKVRPQAEDTQPEIKKSMSKQPESVKPESVKPESVKPESVKPETTVEGGETEAVRRDPSEIRSGVQAGGPEVERKTGATWRRISQ